MTAQLRKRTLTAPTPLDKDEVHKLGNDESFDKEVDVEWRIRKKTGDSAAVADGPSWLPAEILQTTNAVLS
ncbi:unnamed protein product [Didymodactylos carnosus]|uniref:Uncharacterized protein n=1 Tax=Didymodactylos carnosus TaxID=1234261 RepID=A0A815QL81_9BILA|nr:unnamed protein product [Didymodactylos carnosus]CAF4333272.1 unnamed protein product [Didymodactylos carnosus]